MNPALFALAALVPAMLGPPLHAAAAPSLVVSLCSGSTIAIRLPAREPVLPQACPQKACHAGCPRKRIDPAQ